MFTLYICRDSDKEDEQPISSVRPEEVPEVPVNKFLYRGSPPKEDKDDKYVVLYLLSINASECRH